MRNPYSHRPAPRGRPDPSAFAQTAYTVLPPQRVPPQREMAPARSLVLIFILASSHGLRLIAQYPAGPVGRPNSLAYGSESVGGAAAATGSATAGDGTGANFRLDLHFGFLSWFARDCAVSGRPRGPAEFFYLRLVSVDGGAAATGRATATGAAAATVIGAAATVGDGAATAKVRLDLHFWLPFICCASSRNVSGRLRGSAEFFSYA